MRKSYENTLLFILVFYVHASLCYGYEVFSSKLRQIMSFTGVVTDTSWSNASAEGRQGRARVDGPTAAPNGPSSRSSSSSRAVSRTVARAAPTRAVVPVEPGHFRALRIAVAATAVSDCRGTAAGSVSIRRCDSPAAAAAAAAAAPAAVVNVVDTAATYRAAQVSCWT